MMLLMVVMRSMRMVENDDDNYQSENEDDNYQSENEDDNYQSEMKIMMVCGMRSIRLNTNIDFYE